MSYRGRERLESDLHPERRGHPPMTETITQLGRDLNDGLQRALPTVSVPYREVTCLIITWAHMLLSNEAGTYDDFRAFSRLMRRQYHFVVEEVVLDRERPNTELILKMQRLSVQHVPEEDCLLIVYYNGLGFFRQADRKYIIWSVFKPQQKPNGDVANNQYLVARMPGAILQTCENSGSPTSSRIS